MIEITDDRKDGAMAMGNFASNDVRVERLTAYFAEHG
jgi:hypothetical protein